MWGRPAQKLLSKKKVYHGAQMGRKLVFRGRFIRASHCIGGPRLRSGPIRAAAAAARATLESNRPSSRISSTVRLAPAALYQAPN